MIDYYKLKCPAILKTKNTTVIETKRIHTNDCDPGENKAKEVVNQIKRRAQYSTPTVAIANEKSKIWKIGLKTYHENFSKFNLALRTIHALTYVPPAHVKASFELVFEKITDVIEREIRKRFENAGV